MSETVERAARAMMLYANRGNDYWNVTPDDGDRLCDPGKNDYRSMARAAFAAAREPTEAMIQAGMAPYIHGIDDKMRQALRETIIGYWQAMIDETLK